MPPLLELRQAVFGNAGQAALIGSLDLVVESGEKWLIEGPSGSGKSSLLCGLLGFLTLTPGDFWIRGEAATPHRLWALRGETGYVPQELSVGVGPVHQ